METSHSMLYLDTHCHSFSNADDIFCIRSIFPSEADLIRSALTKQNRLSIGVHPGFINTESVEKDIETVRILAADEKVVAIGECGFDRLSDSPITEQEKIFMLHAEISESLRKPVVIHCVRAYPELIAAKKKFKPKQKWIIHGFSKNPELAKSLLEHGFILSFGTKLADYRELRKTLGQLPAGSYLLESDESPPESIRRIYSSAAEARQMKIETVAEEIQKTISESSLNCFPVAL